jgi:threonine ammonia-lyase medium form
MVADAGGMSTETVSLEDVHRARATVMPYLHRTPLLHSATLSRITGTDLWLKAENLQRTGAFKPRGGINAVLNLNADERSRGVIGVSAGNHGAALAYAGRIAGTRATVVMPQTATRSKVAAIEGYGAEVVLVDGGRLLESMEEIQRESGQVFIHPFDNPFVMAGQGTVGLEIAEDLPDVELVVVPVGGGGLISGIATALKALQPGVRLVGVEPEGSSVVSQSLAAGHPMRLERFQTVADGLNAPWSGPRSLSTIQRLVDEIVTVRDEEITAAMGLVLERTKLLAEPAGAAGVAALLGGRIPRTEGRRTVAILSGGNVDLNRLSEMVGQTISSSTA